jgi:nodulation protein F
MVMARELKQARSKVESLDSDCRVALQASVPIEDEIRAIEAVNLIVGELLTGTQARQRPIQGRTGREGSMDQLAQDIIGKIKAHADPEIGTITPQTDLSDLGIHSLELTEIIFDLEEAYDIEVEMNTSEAWSKLSNVGDIVEAVRALIAKKG